MTKKVLLIDDDKDDSELFVEAMRRIDPSIICEYADNGREALALLQDHQADIIFLDINMPVMNGWDTLKAIKANADVNRIPVIMYSTSSYQKDIEHAFSLGSVCFFIKPFSFTELQTALAAIMENLDSGAIHGVQKLKIKHLICPGDQVSH